MLHDVLGDWLFNLAVFVLLNGSSDGKMKQVQTIPQANL
jgi:hypothetical protein